MGDAIAVEDLGSANGSRVGGRALAAGRPFFLDPAAVVTVGAALLVFPDGTKSMPPARDDPRGGAIVAEPAMKRLYELVGLIARGEINVLLCGETGAGKEIVAQALHARSPRASGPFVAVNCAAVPETLFEREFIQLAKSTAPAPSPSGDDTGRRDPDQASLNDEVGGVERRRILAMLEACGGNQSLTARRLGISRRRLLARLDDYAVERPRKRQ